MHRGITTFVQTNAIHSKVQQFVYSVIINRTKTKPHKIFWEKNHCLNNTPLQSPKVPEMSPTYGFYSHTQPILETEFHLFLELDNKL